MFKRSCLSVGIVVFVFLFSGCATMGKNKNLEIQGLKNQVSALETQLQAKDQQIQSLSGTLSSRLVMEEKNANREKKTITEIKSRPNARQIQMALKNAGYEPGTIDGKMGKQTREAIKAFQKANDLRADGKAGKQTWSLLKEYLYKKTK